MKRLFLVISLLACSSILLKAQTLKGVVMDIGSSKPIAQVEIRNLNANTTSETDASGNFTINVKANELLSFHYPGYRVDSLLVIDDDFRRVYLTPLADFNILEDVEVTEWSDAQLEEQIEIAKQQGKIVETPFGGGIAISPSRLFGKDAKEARNRNEILVAEKQDRAIMRKFDPLLITSLTPLKGRDLELFIVKYKPSYEFVQKSDEEQIRLYIMDSFKEFNNLSPQEKEKIQLKKTVPKPQPQ